MTTRRCICHIVSADLWAGAEVMVSHLLPASAVDCDVHAVLLNNGVLADRLRSSSIAPAILSERSLSTWQIARRTRTFLRQNAITVVHSHGYKENMIALLASWGLPGVRLVSTLHGLPETAGRAKDIKYRMVMWVNRQILRWRFHTVAVSHDIHRRLTQQYRFNAHRVTVIHNGIPVQARANNAAHRTEPLTIASCGRFVPVKNYPFFIEVAAELIRRGCVVRFVIAGDGPGLAHVRSLAQLAGIADRCAFPGALTDLAEFWHDAAVFVNTSLHEGIPMSIIEAMVHGVPVVAPAVGGLPEVVADASTGILIEAHDMRLFADAIGRIVADPDLRASMGQAGHLRAAKEFSAESMARAYSAVYSA